MLKEYHDRLKRAALDRRLRRATAHLDAHLLRDIGLSPLHPGQGLERHLLPAGRW